MIAVLFGIQLFVSGIFIGIPGFVAGLVVLLQPAISLTTLAWVLGIWLIVYGAMEIVASFSVRKLGRTAAAAA